MTSSLCHVVGEGLLMRFEGIKDAFDEELGVPWHQAPECGSFNAALA